jgi:hypothetical protein
MESRKEEKVDIESKEVEAQRKKPYGTPKLTRYGPVEEFTNNYVGGPGPE